MGEALPPAGEGASAETGATEASAKGHEVEGVQVVLEPRSHGRSSMLRGMELTRWGHGISAGNGREGQICVSRGTCAMRGGALENALACIAITGKGRRTRALPAARRARCWC